MAVIGTGPACAVRTSNSPATKSSSFTSCCCCCCWSVPRNDPTAESAPLLVPNIATFAGWLLPEIHNTEVPVTRLFVVRLPAHVSMLRGFEDHINGLQISRQKTVPISCAVFFLSPAPWKCQRRQKLKSLLAYRSESTLALTLNLRCLRSGSHAGWPGLRGTSAEIGLHDVSC
jgi:hypothetical protein